MSDDTTVQWELASPRGIQVDTVKTLDEPGAAWNSGHVNDILKLKDRNAIVVATESGGVWVIDDDNKSLPLSDTWDNPDVKCLALGPDGPQHLFAGCTVAYHSAQARSYKAETGSAPVIMETDSAQINPLFTWNPITAALPLTAGRVTRIVVIRNLRRIVVACAKVRDGDTGGIFWATIPPTPFNAGDPPRPPYVWKQAKVVGLPNGKGFWDIAVASTRNDISRDILEDRLTITLVAGGYISGGLVFGQWDSDDDLVFTRPSVALDDGTDFTAMLFDNCGTSSVSSCEIRPRVLYAACAWPDGRLNSLLRSKDGGRKWQVCAAQKLGGTGPQDLIQPLAGDQGQNWNNCISAHPTNADLAILGWQKGPFLTLDEGTSWRPIDGRPHLHDDLHALHFAKNTPESIGDLFVGSDGGVARINLDDLLGIGQPFRSDYNRNLPTLQCYSTLARQFYGTISASSSRSIYAGLQDNGNVTCATFGGTKGWLQIDKGDGGWNAHLPDGNIGYTCYLNNPLGEAVKATIVIPRPGSFDMDAEISVIPVSGDPAGLKAPYGGEAVMEPSYRNPLGQLLLAIAAPSASNRNKVLGLFTGNGDMPPLHWEEIGTVPVDQEISALGSPRGERVFVGTNQGKMYVLDVATGSVVEQSVPLPKPSPSTKMQGGSFLRIVGFNDQAMFALLFNASEAKTDGAPVGTPARQGYVLQLNGDTWNPTAGVGLPNEFMYGMAAFSALNTRDKLGFNRIENGLMVSTDDAVYVSRDGGQIWQRASSGLPRRPHCGDLRFVIDNFREARIYLGTFGRSVWTASLGDAPSKD